MESNTTNVAQAISFAVDEVQEWEGSGGLFLGDEDDPSGLRINEVSAELENAKIGFWSQFTVKTSDGREWNVRVTPKPETPAGAQPECDCEDCLTKYEK